VSPSFKKSDVLSRYKKVKKRYMNWLARCGWAVVVQALLLAALANVNELLKMTR
jgi:hypothetical protein